MSLKRCLSLAVIATAAILSAGGGGAGEKKETQSQTFDLPKEGLVFLFVRLPAKQKAEFLVKSETDSDVDLFVFDANNKLVGRDVEVSANCKVVIEPEEAGLFRVGVINVGEGANKSTITFPGEQVKPKLSAIDPFDVKANEKKIFHLTFTGGQPAVITVDSDKKSDVDLFVYEKGKEKPAAFDQRLSHNCLVGFIPAQTATYRVEVANVSESDNRCTVKHSGKAAAPEDKKDK